MPTRPASVDPPVLKHGPMLRLWLGHLLESEQMREAQHLEFAARLGGRWRSPSNTRRTASSSAVAGEM
ncbi:hypothetical protein [Streptomyces sp. ISL-96]|uniref:hypothetical protein n=1 Tax=Streptomyces sp. ISL-96 TaxID=2819191 RepID=UPI0027E27F57|nr:hypothetical protein [Streptomyces sp. ISL-96]